MKLGYIGLGKMGKNMVLRLIESGHEVVAWNRSPEPMQEVAAAGATVTQTVEAMVEQLAGPRVIWLMLPAGEVTTTMIEQLKGLLAEGDILIDGANSFYKDSIKHGKLLAADGINFIDVGVSGGPTGARHGACAMIGGDPALFTQLEQLFKDISAPDSYQFFPGIGAGHFVKMIHNGIEYGMMQAIAEGFAVIKESNYDLDLKQVARIYNQQSVIESRLIGWTQKAFEQAGQQLKQISGAVKHSGEGQWTVETAQELGVPVPVIAAALQFRIDSTDNPSFTGQVVSALRNQFGGHDVTIGG